MLLLRPGRPTRCYQRTSHQVVGTGRASSERRRPSTRTPLVAQLGLCQALMLSRAYNVGWSRARKIKGGSPGSTPSPLAPRPSTPFMLLRVSTAISQIFSAMKKIKKRERERRRRRGEIKTEYACIKFNTFVTMATIQHVIHLSSCIRADGLLCLGDHGCLEQSPPPFQHPPAPTRAPHPGHSPRCYFSLIHVWLVFFMTNRST